MVHFSHDVVAYLADSFDQTDEKYCPEAAESGEDGSQQRQERRHEHAEEHQHFSADLLCQHSAGDVRHGVAVEERPENGGLSFHVPLEDSVRLQHGTTLAIVGQTNYTLLSLSGLAKILTASSYLKIIKCRLALKCRYDSQINILKVHTEIPSGC